MEKKNELKLTFGTPTPKNIEMMKKLNAVVLPISYGDDFYKYALAPENADVTKYGESTRPATMAAHVVYLQRVCRH